MRIDTMGVSWSPACRKPAHATDGHRLRRRTETRVEERGRQSIATKERRLTVRQAPKMPMAGRRDPPAEGYASVSTGHVAVGPHDVDLAPANQELSDYRLGKPYRCHNAEALVHR